MSAQHPDGTVACAAFEDQLAELALGVLDGRERARALRHAQSCAACRDQLAALSALGDRIVQLAPPIDPPDGFSERLATRLAAVRAEDQGARNGPRTNRRIAIAGLAAAAMVAVGFGTGALVSHHPTSARVTAMAAPLVERGVTVGEVMVSGGDPTWVFLSMRGGSHPAALNCTLTYRDGSTTTIGSLRMHSGEVRWDTSLHGRVAGIAALSVRSATGAVVATARFTL